MEHRISLPEVQSRLDDLLRRVEAGENIIITRDGRDFAQLRPVEEKRDDKDRLPSLEEWRSSIDAQGDSLSSTVRKQRTEERY